MAYADAANYNRSRSMKGLPIGAIVPWAGQLDSIPKGWVSCNGTNVPINRYPLLFDVIGNTYGGTSGSTFRIPEINNSSQAIMDIFQGHFSYLQTAGDSTSRNAHKPEYSVLSADTFWSNVGLSDNGNKYANSTQEYTSTIDVVGVLGAVPSTLVANHANLTLSSGDYQVAVGFNERKLSDNHMPLHTHNIDTTQDTSFTNTGNRAARDAHGVNECGINWQTTTATAGRDTTGQDQIYPRSGDNDTDVSIIGCGGGDVIAWNSGNGTRLQSGDGCNGGQLQSTTPRYATSLSNPAKEWSQVFGHDHLLNNYTFTSRYRVVNPGIVNDVRIGTVAINNSSGRNFCTINMSSVTPNLSMVFIIRAY